MEFQPSFHERQQQEQHSSIKLLIVHHGESEDKVADRVYWDTQKEKWNQQASRLPGNGQLLLSPPASRASIASTMDLKTAIQERKFIPDRYPPINKLDPQLTKRGHCQAQAALLAISKELPRTSKVAVFSSPLRRSVGSALMMGRVPWDPKIYWPKPPSHANDHANCHAKLSASSENNKNNENGTMTNCCQSYQSQSQRHTSSLTAMGGLFGPRVIPITVLNGLGDFDNTIAKSGGIEALAPNGLIPCAADAAAAATVSASSSSKSSSRIPRGDHRNNGSSKSPFGKALLHMPSKSGNVHKHTCLVRFMQPNGSNLTGMVDPKILPGIDETPDEKREQIKHQKDYFEALKVQTPPPQGPTHHPLAAIDEAIRQTAEMHCNVCIVLANKEAITQMAQKCNFHCQLDIFQCMIGSFGASIESIPPNNTTRVVYNYWYAWKPNLFGWYSMPISISPRNNSSRVMLFNTTKHQIECLCCLDISKWPGRLPSEVWLTCCPKDAPQISNMHQKTVVPITPKDGYRDLLSRAILPLAQQGQVLYFDSLVTVQQMQEGGQKHRRRPYLHRRIFRFKMGLSRDLQKDKRIVLWYK